jgi:small conductance mechanosensitive channel
MDITMQQLTDFIAAYGLRVIGAILILIIGRIIAGFGRRIVRRLMEKTKTDPSVITFAASFIYVLILIFAVLAALSKFGVETTSIVAVLGAAGFAIGFAMQGSLSNFAAGLLTIIFKYYKVGDYIQAAGVGGTVKEIRMFSTVLSTPDNVQITVPSGKIFGDTLINYSANDTRRVDLVVGIGYSSSIQKAVEVIEGLLKSDSRILSEPAYQIAVSELADSSVNLVVRPWVKASDYWAVRFDLNRAIKEALDSNGIEIPFPQRTVHMVQAS